ncbi:hypothetical protein ACFL2P_02725 [Candidatus Moduliflexota bacterium]
MPESRAVVLGLYDTGLSVLRCLARAGIEVTAFDHDPLMPGFRSRFGRCEQCPEPKTDPEKLLEYILRRTEKGASILYPCSEDYVRFVSLYREALESGGCSSLLPEGKVVESIVNKTEQYRLVGQLGLEVPKTTSLGCLEDMRRALPSISYPALIKPARTSLWRELYQNKKGVAVGDRASLEEVCGKVLSAGIEVCVQEIVPGPCSNNYEFSAYVDSRGKLVQAFTVRKIRQHPSDFGFGTMTETVRNDRVEELGRTVLSGLRWKGFANIEFKKDMRTGTYKFIEVNARLWQQVGQAEAAGLNFPLLQHSDLSGCDPAGAREYPQGVKWLNIKHDVITAFRMISKGELTLGAWLGSLRGVRAFGLFAWDDVQPFLYDLHYGGSLLRLPGMLGGLLFRSAGPKGSRETG